MLELPPSDINREGSRSETASTETNSLRQLPIVDEECGPHDLHEDVSGLGTVSIARKSRFFYYKENQEITLYIFLAAVIAKIKMHYYCSFNLFFLVVYPFTSHSQRKGNEKWMKSVTVENLNESVILFIFDFLKYFYWNNRVRLLDRKLSDWHASDPEFDPHVRHILSRRLGHEKISTAILPLLLIQEEQLSVTGERMCTKYW